MLFPSPCPLKGLPGAPASEQRQGPKAGHCPCCGRKEPLPFSGYRAQHSHGHDLPTRMNDTLCSPACEEGGCLLPPGGIWQHRSTLHLEQLFLAVTVWTQAHHRPEEPGNWHLRERAKAGGEQGFSGSGPSLMVWSQARVRAACGKAVTNLWAASLETITVSLQLIHGCGVGSRTL